MAARPPHHARHRHRTNHSLHLARQTARHAPLASCVLFVVSRHDLRVYASCDVDEEDLCVEVRGVVVGGEDSGQGDCPEGCGGIVGEDEHVVRYAHTRYLNFEKGVIYEKRKNKRNKWL